MVTIDVRCTGDIKWDTAFLEGMRMMVELMASDEIRTLGHVSCHVTVHDDDGCTVGITPGELKGPKLAENLVGPVDVLMADGLEFGGKLLFNRIVLVGSDGISWRMVPCEVDNTLMVMLIPREGYEEEYSPISCLCEAPMYVGGLIMRDGKLYPQYICPECGKTMIKEKE